VQHRDLDAEARTKLMSCSTTTTVWSLIDLAQQLGRLMVSASVMPATGSSTSSSFGSCASSMPISSHCFWPWLRSPPSRRGPDQPDGSRIASMRAHRRCGVRAPNRARTGRADPLQRQQNVVLDGVALEHGRLLEFAADAEFGDLGLVERVRSMAPSNSTSPSSGRVLPVMTSIIVVLPAPLGPMMARISPGASERQVVEGAEAVERHMTPSR
jgi:hypothetical protein